MKFRLTMEIEVELASERAMQKYGTADPYAISQEMQREFLRGSGGEVPKNMRLLGVVIVPANG